MIAAPREDEELEPTAQQDPADEGIKGFFEMLKCIVESKYFLDFLAFAQSDVPRSEDAYSLYPRRKPALEMLYQEYDKLTEDQQLEVATRMCESIESTKNIQHIVDVNPPAPFEHLDGERSFRALVEAGVPGVSRFAKYFPKEFLAVAKGLMKWCKDAFKVVPPAADPSKRIELDETIVAGRCQSGKTRVTLVLAWLHWHYCGCYTYLGGWKYTSSVEVG
jgi:hypothetical protein